jgi:protein-tyrosine phosphatase
MRDFGGQCIGPGRRVRQRILFRSGSFSALMPDHHALLDSLGIRAVIDLRSIDERANHPSEWVPATAALVHSQISDTNVMLREILSAGITDAQACHASFSKFYTQIPELYAVEFSKMLTLLAQGDVPLIVNCSAGKDRTGVAVALVLTIAGVDRSDISADYMMTRERLHDNPAFMQMLSRRISNGYAALPESAQKVLMGVHLDHLNAAFAQIDLDYGSLSQYLESRLSISQKMQNRIREVLIEDY